MLHVINEPCVRCGCFAFENDPIDGLTCLLCARVLHPVTPLRLVREDAERDFERRTRRRAAVPAAALSIPGETVDLSEMRNALRALR